MPWTAAQAKEKHADLSDSEADEWAKVANETRKRLLSEGKSEAEADAEAVKAANAAVKKKEPDDSDRKTPPLKEQLVSEEFTERTEGQPNPLRVDRDKGRVYDVKLLGPHSRNKRTYTEAAMRNAVGLYEGRKCYTDHADGARKYRELLGDFHGTYYREGDDATRGIYAREFHYNPEHSEAKKFAWDAEHAPGRCGFSHHAKTSRRREPLSDGTVVIEAIEDVRCIDLVDEPGATGGVFEQYQKEEVMSVTLEQLKTDRPDIVSAILKERADSDDAKKRDAEFERLKKENDDFKTKEAIAARREKVETKLKEAKLDTADKQIVSEVFMESCLGAKDDATLEQIINDRRSIVGLAVPRVMSRAQHQTNANAKFSDPDAQAGYDQAQGYVEDQLKRRGLANAK